MILFGIIIFWGVGATKRANAGANLSHAQGLSLGTTAKTLAHLTLSREIRILAVEGKTLPYLKMFGELRVTKARRKRSYKQKQPTLRHASFECKLLLFGGLKKKLSLKC